MYLCSGVRIDWGIRINVAKCGIMHIRKKKVMRNEIRYMIDGEEIPIASCYKYLGCVVDEHLGLKEMVQDKVVAGKKALGAWFQWCMQSRSWRYRHWDIQEANEFAGGVLHAVWS